MIRSGSRRHPRLLFCWAASQPVKTTLAVVPPSTTVPSINLSAATPVMLIAIGRRNSPTLHQLLTEPVNSLQQQTVSAEIPIASDAKLRHISRGFLSWRFAYAGPRVRRAIVMGPPSANLHIQRHIAVSTSCLLLDQYLLRRQAMGGPILARGAATSVAHLFTGTRGIIRRGRRKKIVARTRSTIRGMTRLLPARKPRQPARAVSRAFDRGASLTRRVRASGNRSTRGVRTTPGLRQVTVTPVSATSAASAAENDCT
jgi:hypothetical protein